MLRRLLAPSAVGAVVLALATLAYAMLLRRIIPAGGPAVPLPWLRFCVISFGILALGTIVDYVARRGNAKKGHLARHVTALCAFAAALPALVLPEGAPVMIRAAAVIASLLFAFTVAFTLLKPRFEKRSDNAS